MNAYEIIERLFEEKRALQTQVNDLAQVIRDLKSGNRTLEDITLGEDGSFHVEASHSFKAASNGVLT